MAERNSASLKLTGFKELEAALLKLPKELAEIAEAAALREGMKPVNKAAKAIAANIKDTGLLAKSIGLNVRRIRHKGQYANRYTARVGAKSMRQKVTRRRKIKGIDGVTSGIRFYEQFANPANYAHLVEYGTSKIAARPFIRPALQSAEQDIMNGLQKGYALGMIKVIRKIRTGK